MPNLNRSLIQCGLVTPYGVIKIGQHWFTLRAKHNDCDFANGIFKFILLHENSCTCILFQISLKFITKGQIVKKSSLNQVMAWHQKGTRPLFEPMMA